MKKILYIASFLLVTLTACNPMEDTYNEIDEANKEEKADEKYFAQRTVLDANYTLTDEDYALSTNEDVKKYKNFSGSLPAKDYLAQILNDKMVYGEAGSDYVITYKYYRGSLSYLNTYVAYLEAIDALETYELTTEDYDSMGTGSGEPGKYNNFSDSTPPADYLPDFLRNKFPNAEANDVVVVTYKYYSGSVSDVTVNWQFDGTTWAENATAGPEAPQLPEDVTVYELTAEDYDSMGTESGEPGKYNNFSSSVKPEDYLPTFLRVKYPYAKEESKYLLVYKFYKGGDEGTVIEAKEYTLTEGVWTVYSSTVTQEATMSYKTAKKTWEFVPPITFVKTDEAKTAEYTLTEADYELVGNGRYHNFDTREGKTEEDEAVIIEKISKILKAQTTVAIEEGGVYAVTYAYYDGTAGEATINLKAVLEE